MKNQKIQKSFAFLASFVLMANIVFVTPVKAVVSLEAETPIHETEEAIAQCKLVSDTDTFIANLERNAVLADFVPGWASIEGASWIWSETQVSNPEVDTTLLFRKEFNLNAVPTSAMLVVSVDDYAQISVNGNVVANITEDYSYAPGNEKTYDIASSLVAGNNVIEFSVRNRGIEGAVTPINPAGLLYSLDIKGASCGDTVLNTAPVITLIGANPLTLTVGTPFPMNDFHAHDAEDGDVTGLVTIMNPMTFVMGPGAINTNVVGTYTIVYGVKDSGGLSAVNVTRTVHVVPAKESENTAPTIALIGNSPMEITAGKSFVEPGVTANDLEDGSIPFPSRKIVVTGSVDTNTVGTYTLTYTVTDNGGLTASIQRTVNVVSVVPAVTGTTGGRSGGRRGGGSSDPQVLGASTVNTGEVLGASTCAYLNDYLKKGWKNDLVEMLKLKTFLNIFEKENLALTGDFDADTFNAVSRFQAKYKSDILIPWDNKEDSTGFVYILTKKKINEIFCNTTIDLSPSEKTEVENFVK